MQSLRAIVRAAILAVAAGAAALVGAMAGRGPRHDRDGTGELWPTERHPVHPAFGPPLPRLPGA